MPARHPLPDPPVQLVTLDADRRDVHADVLRPGDRAARVRRRAGADLQAALEALSRIGAGNVDVSGPAGGPFELRFGGALTGRDIAVVEPDDARARRQRGGHDAGARAIAEVNRDRATR